MSDKSNREEVPLAEVLDYREPARAQIPRVEVYQRELDNHPSNEVIAMHEDYGLDLSEGKKELLKEQRAQIEKDYGNACKAYVEDPTLSPLKQAQYAEELAKNERAAWKREPVGLLKKSFGERTHIILTCSQWFFGACTTMGGMLSLLLNGSAATYGGSFAAADFVFAATAMSCIAMAGSAVIQEKGENWLTGATLWYRERKATRNVRRLEREQEKANERKLSESQKIGEDVAKVSLLATLMTVIGLRRKEDKVAARTKEPQVKGTLTGHQAELKDATEHATDLHPQDEREISDSQKFRIAKMEDKVTGAIAVELLAPADLQNPSAVDMEKAAAREALAERDAADVAEAVKREMGKAPAARTVELASTLPHSERNVAKIRQ